MITISERPRRREYLPLLAASLFFAGLFAGLSTELSARPFTQQDLVTIGRAADVHATPDGHYFAYDLTSYDAQEGRQRHSIWVGKASSGIPVKIADGTAPRWSSDGQTLYFLVKGQLWSACPRCSDARPTQITNLAGEIASYRIAPGGRHIVAAMSVYPGSEDAVRPGDTDRPNPAPGKSGRLYDKLFVRHWMNWDDGRKNHLFAIPLDPSGAASAPVPLMRHFDGDSPSKPGGGDDEYAISPDGGTVVFSARVAGRTEAWSTNFDLYSVPIDGSAPPKNLTAENAAWDTGPVFSPDGKWLAYRAMKRPTFEADRFAVMIMNRATGETREVSPAWDRSAQRLAFGRNAHMLYVQALDDRQGKIFALDIASGRTVPMTGAGRVVDFDIAPAKGGDIFFYASDSFDRPAEIFRQLRGAPAARLTKVTDAAMRGVTPAEYQSFEFKGWNDETVKGWVFKPVGFKPGVKYPAVLLMHGGPQSSWSNSWSPLWNPQVWAGWGYAIVMIDPHGSTGYGQSFTDAVSGHWGDRPLDDFKAGWRAVEKRFPWIDKSRACAAGPSYGAYMTFWMAGVWKEPWKCFVTHNGIFDNRLMGYSTEELWAYEWENGGATPWEAPERYEEFNPVRHVANWSTPMLIIHSDRDFRIPLDQGLGAFTALQRRGIPSQFLQFSDEGHRVVQPRNSLQWHDTVEAWLKRWIASPAQAADHADAL